MPNGGEQKPRDVMGYKPPSVSGVLGHKGPGLGGDNHDEGEEGTSEHMTGKPGIGGTNHGNKGSQGSH